MGGVQSLDADGTLVRVAVKTVPLKQWAVTRELRHRIKVALDDAGIDIPFPQRTIWMRTENGSDAPTPTSAGSGSPTTV
jgi:moderate conductance mechanosensitive channel